MKGLLFNQEVELFRVTYAGGNEVLFLATNLDDMRQYLTYSISQGKIERIGTASRADVRRLKAMEDALTTMLNMAFHPSVFDTPAEKIICLGHLKPE